MRSAKLRAGALWGNSRSLGYEGYRRRHLVGALPVNAGNIKKRHRHKRSNWDSALFYAVGLKVEYNAPSDDVMQFLHMLLLFNPPYLRGLLALMVSVDMVFGLQA